MRRLPRTLWSLLLGLCLTVSRGHCDETIAEFDFTQGDAHGWKPTNNLSPFDLTPGALTTRAIGGDANLMVQGLALPTATITHLIVRMKASQPGPNQVYFATSDYPDLTGKPVPTEPCPGDDQWHDVTFRLQGITGFSGTLTLLRIDPVQGADSAEIAIQSVRLVRFDPRPRIERFSATALWLEPGDSTVLTLAIANRGGPLNPADITAALKTVPAGLVHASPPTIDVAADGLGADVTWSLTAAQRGSATLSAALRLRDQGALHCTTRLFVETPPGGPAATPEDIADDELALVMVPGPDGTVAAAVLATRTGAAWQPVGTLFPLAHVAAGGGADAWSEDLTFTVAKRGRRTLDLRAEREWGECLLHFRLLRHGQIEVHTELRPATDVGLRRFSGPILRVGLGAAGAEKETAVFPGQEFLGPGDPSSNLEVVGPFLHYRPSPDPRDVTVPVLAVCRQGVLAGIMWDPLQDWGLTPGGMPVAEFASPNFLDGQANHRLGCFLPSAPWRTPNTANAAEPCQLQGGQKIRLDTRLFALPGKDSIDAVPLWYEAYGEPPPPPAAHSNKECLDLLIQGYAETLWEPEAKGFVTHRNHTGEKPVWQPSFAARVLTHYLRTGETTWIENIGIKPGTPLIEVIGSMFKDPTLPPTPASIQQQAPNGHWPYQEQTGHDVGTYSDGFRTTLGKEGAFYSGYTGSQFLLPLLSHAVRWGDDEAIQAAIMSLEALMAERIPKGAQTWEVPADTPDLYGAARLADCFIIGYRLTGDARYLEKARYWLYCGLPFLYAYAIPGTGKDIQALTKDGQSNGSVYFLDSNVHPYTPWGAIPVFGTSLYRVNWFGTLVHFCGLVWANSVTSYLEEADDPLLAAAANGVTRVGVNLTLDRRPYVGLLPDGVDVRVNRVQGALIGPMRVEPALRQVMKRPAYAGSGATVWRHQGKRLHVQSLADLSAPDLTPVHWSWKQTYLPGQTCETMVVRCTETPTAISVGRHPLPKVADLTTVTEGWAPLPDVSGFGFRVQQHRRTERVVIDMAKEQ